MKFLSIKDGYIKLSEIHVIRINDNPETKFPFSVSVLVHNKEFVVCTCVDRFQAKKRCDEIVKMIELDCNK